MTGLWQYAGPGFDPPAVLPGWWAARIKELADEGDERAAEMWRHLSPVQHEPTLFEAPLPPQCDFHPELHPLVVPTIPRPRHEIPTLQGDLGSWVMRGRWSARLTRGSSRTTGRSAT